MVLFHARITLTNAVVCAPCSAHHHPVRWHHYDSSLSHSTMTHHHAMCAMTHHQVRWHHRVGVALSESARALRRRPRGVSPALLYCTALHCAVLWLCCAGAVLFCTHSHREDSHISLPDFGVQFAVCPPVIFSRRTWCTDITSLARARSHDRLAVYCPGCVVRCALCGVRCALCVVRCVCG